MFGSQKWTNLGFGSWFVLPLIITYRTWYFGTKRERKQDRGLSGVRVSVVVVSGGDGESTRVEDPLLDLLTVIGDVTHRTARSKRGFGRLHDHDWYGETGSRYVTGGSTPVRRDKPVQSSNGPLSYTVVVRPSYR